jgi:hypothetical protein
LLLNGFVGHFHMVNHLIGGRVFYSKRLLRCIAYEFPVNKILVYGVYHFIRCQLESEM